MSLSGGTLDPPYQHMVVGYGNTLRSDDGAGQRVAEEVASWQLHGVAVRTVHQLVPELVEDLKVAARVIFIDATADEAGVALRKIEPRPANQVLDHTCDPRDLLALTGTLYGHSPEGWLLTIPGSDFGMGENFSAGAQRSMAEAIGLLRVFLQRAK